MSGAPDLAADEAIKVAAFGFDRPESDQQPDPQNFFTAREYRTWIPSTDLHGYIDMLLNAGAYSIRIDCFFELNSDVTVEYGIEADFPEVVRS